MSKYNKDKFTHMTITRILRSKIDQVRNDIANEISDCNLSLGQVLDHLIDFYKNNYKQDQEPVIIVGGHKTAYKRGSIVYTKREVVYIGRE